jgi:plasmid rolling circle replication initiator protein Rep
VLAAYTSCLYKGFFYTYNHKEVVMFDLSEISKRDRKWDDKRSRSADVESLYRQAGFEKYPERVKNCSKRLDFVGEVSEEGEIKLKLHSAHFCRVRNCPVCQWRRSLGWTARFLQSYPVIQEEFPTARWILLTLTCSNCPITELRSTIDHLNKSYRKLTLRKDFPAIGWIKAIEVTNKDPRPSYAHPHLHCLLMVPGGYFAGKNYINQKQWQVIWQECLKQEKPPIIHIKAIKPNDDQSLIDALAHTFKYTTKSDDLLPDVEWFREYVNQTHNMRTVSIGGVLRGKISEQEITEDEMIGENSEPINDPQEWTFYWQQKLRKYRGDLRS